MKAIVQNAYGSSDVLKLKEIEKPVVKDNEVLIKVYATSINAGDYFSMRGTPWAARLSVGFPKPKDYILGWDVAGCVESVGEKVSSLKPGDPVFGTCMHTFAEYVCASPDVLAKKPDNLTFEQAAAVPTAALTALQGLRDMGKVYSGQKVLINGASGGVGSFAVQIAKALGAEVTGVCSTANLEMVRSIGADHIVDYTKEDFTKNGQQYDLILDQVGNRSLSDLRRALSPAGKIQPNTGHGGMTYVFKSAVLSLFMKKHGSLFVTKPNHDDLIVLKDFIESGKVRPVIDKTYPLSRIPEALACAEKGHVRGKVVITVADTKSQD